MTPTLAMQASSMRVSANTSRLLARVILFLRTPSNHGKPHGCTCDLRGSGPLINLLKRALDHVAQGGHMNKKSIMYPCMSAMSASWKSLFSRSWDLSLTMSISMTLKTTFLFKPMERRWLARSPSRLGPAKTYKTVRVCGFAGGDTNPSFRRC